MAYRNFCRKFLKHPKDLGQGKTMAFLQCLAHVVAHLDEILKMRLKSTDNGAKLLDTLRRYVYNFVLHALKLPLLTATEFESPQGMYSLDSIGMLRITTLPPRLLADEFHQKVAKVSQKREEWETDCGRLGRMILNSPHVLRLTTEREGRMHSHLLPLTVVVSRAENLPDITTLIKKDVIDAYVKVRVLYDEVEVVSSAKTSVKMNNANPVWEEHFLICVPDHDWLSEECCKKEDMTPDQRCIDPTKISLVFELKDFEEMTKLKVFTEAIARTEPISAVDLHRHSRQFGEVRLGLHQSGPKISEKQLASSALYARIEQPDLAAKSRRSGSSGTPQGRRTSGQALAAA